MLHRCTLTLLSLAAIQSSASAQEGRTRVEFPQAAYEILIGQELQAPVRINPLPASGLFSYGLVVTVEGTNGLAGITTLTPQTTLSFDGVNGPGSRGVTAEPGKFTSKGTADIFLPNKPNHMDPALGTVSIAGLPDGTYTLRLAPYNTLGPTESVFVDGRCRAMDAELTFGTATLTVIGRPEASITALGPMTPDRQTGHLIQEYEVKNTGLIAAVFRVFIRNIPAGSQLWNAHGTVEGIPYFDLPASLAPGATQKITLEYYSEDRATIPQPQFELVAATPATLTPAGLSTALQPRATLASGNVLLELNSIAGQSYYIQYTGDPAAAWKTALPKVEGTGNRIQWLDNGPPKTESHPSTVPARFYRILVAEPAP